MKTCDSPFCGCLYFSSNAMARVLTAMADDAFAPVGLTGSYAFVVLAVTDKPGIRPSEISEQMLLRASTVTRLVEKLEVRKLVTRTSEGRSTFVHPTPQAVKLRPQIEELWQALEHRYSKALGVRVAKSLARDVVSAADKLVDA